MFYRLARARLPDKIGDPVGVATVNVERSIAIQENDPFQGASA
jgi:hypothetical protein